MKAAVAAVLLGLLCGYAHAQGEYHSYASRLLERGKSAKRVVAARAHSADRARARTRAGRHNLTSHAASFAPHSPSPF